MTDAPSLTAAQRAHLRVLSVDWQSAGTLRLVRGVYNAHTLLALRRAALVEYHSAAVDRPAPRRYSADRDDLWRLTVRGARLL